MVVFMQYPVNKKGLKYKSSIQYKMGWFWDNDDRQDDSQSKDDNQNGSGVEIDWDAYNQLNNPGYEPEDRGTIEVPADAETVIYESPDGETYEIPVSDLIDADVDGEIEYKSKGRSVLSGKNKKVLGKYSRFGIHSAMLFKPQTFARVR